jgi:ribose transport system substrate-binding protein
MRKLLLLGVAVLALSAGQALAKKQLVIVVKGLDNPFFEAINQGCQKWNKENPDSEYECFYTGPASTSDEAGEAQIVQDMLGKADTAAIAISPSNAKLIAQTLKTANPTIPVMTLDADLAAEDSATTSRRPSRTAARSARSRAIRAPTTFCAAPRACATRSPARKAWLS